MKEDYQLTLFDRIEVIKMANEKYDLEHNAYISFSGGKDSTILHYLVDIALPNNKIPRVFINTGIEYNLILKFVKELAKQDERIVILPPSKPIKRVLEEYGYPFKSKQHSLMLSVYQRSGVTRSIERYLGTIESTTQHHCPKMLLYQFTPQFKIKCSDKCCHKLKKEPVHKWQKENGKSITITGMRNGEGGERLSIKGCIITDKDKKVVKFHPLLVVSEEWEKWFIDQYNIKLCELYYPPYNFKRSGCKGCVMAIDLQEQLDIMEKLLPNERKQCEMIWQPIYEEYRKIGYRLRSHEQLSLFDEESLK